MVYRNDSVVNAQHSFAFIFNQWTQGYPIVTFVSIFYIFPNRLIKTFYIELDLYWVNFYNSMHFKSRAS